MKVYRLSRVPERFMTAGIDTVNLIEQLGGDVDTMLPIVLETLEKDEPMASFWKEGITSEFRPLSPASTENPEISLWESRMVSLLLNARAYDAFKDRLAPEGEFLPVTVDGEPMHIFNCLSYAKEDESLCVRRYVDGELAVGLETLFFDDEDVAGRFLFKSKLQGGSELYCSYSFKALCEEVGLKGLRFDEDLLSPF
ncbi:hypothetical protein Q2E61_13655 [Microbulbifer thermotolerans]|uniref:hypothetical protein n=1 Tax=Microbulbifer thermotolerans TaxID=252514 RepID=UPI00267281CD|nr:hypothetical protein [Microbulbifer thermotolerans]WKT59939.1 hypothetical protein Q2E61_13655 [Microbulbifer thermotolerans]